jgi:hypothetical protein
MCNLYSITTHQAAIAASSGSSIVSSAISNRCLDVADGRDCAVVDLDRERQWRLAGQTCSRHMDRDVGHAKMFRSKGLLQSGGPPIGRRVKVHPMIGGDVALIVIVARGDHLAGFHDLDPETRRAPAKFHQVGSGRSHFMGLT